jgi:uncharacterized glyoxalase superfamily protein PhnB
MLQTATLRCTQSVPCVAYADAPAAIGWLERALGARVGERHAGPDGVSIAHAELWFGDACVMMGTHKGGDRPPTRPGEGVVYLVAESRETVDALHDRAVAAGARISIALCDTDYGSHDFACLDPEGNFWSIGTYAPPAPPSEAA